MFEWFDVHVYKCSFFYSLKFLDILRISSKKTPSTVVFQSMETFPLEQLEDPPDNDMFVQEVFFEDKFQPDDMKGDKLLAQPYDLASVPKLRLQYEVEQFEDNSNS